MNTKRTTLQSTILFLGSLLSWAALILQLYVAILNRRFDVFQAVIQYFSYFTILTNLLVAICYTALLFGKPDNLKDYFCQPKTLTAIAVYITVVGLVYNIILRSLWNPQGAQQLADELLHSVNPVLFVIYWLLFVPKSSLRLKDTFRWLGYPIAYSIYILIRGSITDLYPYPFVDVNMLGYPQVLINSICLCLAFLLLSFGFVGVGKLLSNSGQLKEM